MSTIVARRNSKVQTNVLKILNINSTNVENKLKFYKIF